MTRRMLRLSRLFGGFFVACILAGAAHAQPPSDFGAGTSGQPHYLQPRIRNRPVLNFSGGTTGNPVSQPTMLTNTSSCASRSLGAGCIGAANVQDIIGSLANGSLYATPLSDGSTISIDLSQGAYYTWGPGASGHTLSNPTNATPHQQFGLLVQQPASGGPYTIAFGSDYLGVTGSAFSASLNTAASAWTLIRCEVIDTTPHVYCYQPGAGSGSSAFSALTSGTNNSAAMALSSGATMNFASGTFEYGGNAMTFPGSAKTLAATDWSNMGSMPTSADLLLSAGNNAAPTGLAPVNGDCVVASGGAWGAGSCGGATSFSAHPGLGNSPTTFNAGTQTVTTDLYQQAASYAVTGAYSLNATTGASPCSSGSLCDTARLILANGSASIAVTAPNPAGTLAPYQIADEAGHGFTIPTVGGTATFVGCISGSPTTLTVPAGMAVQLFDQGSGANTYFCTFQASSYAPNGNTLKFATVTGSLTASDCIQADANGNIETSGAACGGGGGGTGVGYVTGQFYMLSPGGDSTISAGGGATPTTATAYCYPAQATGTATIATLSTWIQTAAAGGHYEQAIYTAVNGVPHALVAATATLSTASTGVSTSGTISAAVTAGSWYFVCTNTDASAGGTVQFRYLIANTNGGDWGAYLVGGTTANAVLNLQSLGVLTTAETYNTWPSTWSTTWSISSTNQAIAGVAGF